MDTFENRERGFESAFAHDEQVSFRVRIESLRRLGRWASETRNVGSPDALVERALRGADDETIVAGLASEAGLSQHRIRLRLAAFALEAARDIQG